MTYELSGPPSSEVTVYALASPISLDTILLLRPSVAPQKIRLFPIAPARSSHWQSLHCIGLVADEPNSVPQA